MAVILYADWGNGQPLSGSTYTAVTPDIPNSHTFTFNSSASLVQDNDAPWNGQYLADLASGVRNVTSTVSSATVNTTSGRFLVQFAPQSANNTRMLNVQATNFYDGGVRVSRDSSGNLLVICERGGGGMVNEVSLGTFPSSESAVEVIYDFNNATANQRLRARTWALSGSAGTFNDSTYTAGSAGTSNEFVALRLGDDGSGATGLYVGRVIFSDDTTEDLSTYGQSTQSNAPRAAAYYRMMRSR